MKRHVTDALQLYLEVSAFSEKHDAPWRILLSYIRYLVPDPVMHEHEGIHVCELRCLDKLYPSQVPLWVLTGRY